MCEITKAIESALYYRELNNGNEIPTIGRESLLAIFNIKGADLDYIARQTKSFCKSWSSMTLYNNHFFIDENGKVEAITIVGISYFCKNLNYLHANLPEYEIIFTSLAIDWFYKVDFYKKHATTIRNSYSGRSSNIDYETVAEFQITKGIEQFLKTPKIDAEDENHIFYKKKVVITGEFDKYPIRNDMAALLHNVGAKNQTGVNGATDYVILGKNAGPKKLEKIAELEIKTITEEKFCEIFKIS